MRVLVVDESEARAALVRAALTSAGHEVVASLSPPLDLSRAVEEVRPDVIVIDTASPPHDALEHVVMVNQRAGVSAYVVDGLDSVRVNGIFELACARFEEFQRLKAKLEEARLKLAERQLRERLVGKA